MILNLLKVLSFAFSFSLLFNAGVSAQIFNPLFHDYDDVLPSIDEIIHGDMNGDGSLDFILTGNSRNELFIAFGNGLSSPIVSEIEADFSVFSIEVVDFDSDGDLDFTGSAPFENESYVWLNDGSGSFVREVLPFEDYNSIHFADLNNNGQAEIVVSVDEDLILYRLSSGNATQIETFFSDVFAGDAGDITTIDYDQDGDQDIVVALARDGVTLFRQNGNLNFADENLFDETFNVDDLFVANFNQDGIPDFLVQSEFDRASSILVSVSGTEYQRVRIPNDFGPNFFSIPGDFNEDGVDIIIHTDSDTPFDTGVSLYSFDTNTGELVLQGIVEEHSRVCDGDIADIDGDGDLDFYLYTNDQFDPGLVFFISDFASAVDADGDGFDSTVDCNDNNAEVNPGQTEVPYNGIDDDCDSTTLDDDLDQDSFLMSEDCDDNNPEINPAAQEVPYNGIDEDCNSATLDDDLDQDGFLLAEDCDDNNGDINPNAQEIPGNGIDEDCDGIDEPSATHSLGQTIIDIYPNPASDFIKIEVDGQLNFKATLYSQEGKLVSTFNNSSQLSISAVPTGSYLLEIEDQDSGQKIVERMIIRR